MGKIGVTMRTILNLDYEPNIYLCLVFKTMNVLSIAEAEVSIGGEAHLGYLEDFF